MANLPQTPLVYASVCQLFNYGLSPMLLKLWISPLNPVISLLEVSFFLIVAVHVYSCYINHNHYESINVLTQHLPKRQSFHKGIWDHVGCIFYKLDKMLQAGSFL